MEEQNENNSQKQIDRRLGYIILLFIFILAFICTGYAIYCIKNPDSVRIIVFNKIGNLKIDDQVTIKGIRAGQISDIKWRKHNILVFIKTHKPVHFHYGYRIDNNDVGYMGDRMLSIDIGDIKAPLIPEKDTLTGTFNTGLSEVLGMAGQLYGIVDSFKAVSSKLLNGTTTQPSISSQIKTIIVGADSLSNNLNKITLAINGGTSKQLDLIDKELRNLCVFSASAAKTAPEYLSNVQNIIETLEKTLIKLDTLSAKAMEITSNYKDSNSMYPVEKKITDLHDAILRIKTSLIQIKIKL